MNVSIFLDIERDGKELELEIIAEFEFSTPDSCWSPGDPESMEILSAKRLDNKEDIELTEDEESRAVDKIREKAYGDAQDDHD